MDIFFDNGILKNILKKSTPVIAQKFKEEFSSKIVQLSHETTHHYISAPLMLIEYVGIKLIPIFDRYPEIKMEVTELASATSFNADQFGTNLLRIFEQRVSNEKITDYAFLLSRLDHEERFRDPYGIEIANLLYRSNLESPETRYRFITELSLDEIQGVNFAEIFEDNLVPNLTDLLTSFGRSLLDPNLNVTFARILHQWYMSITGYPQVSDQAKQCKYDFNHRHQDRLDTLLVHFACFGHKRGNDLHRVCCLTNEQPERMINRCRAYLIYIARIQKSIKQLDGRLINPKPGIILFINQTTGEVLREVDIQKIWNEALEICGNDPNS